MKPKPNPDLRSIAEDILRTGKVVDSVQAVAIDLTGPRRISWFKARCRLAEIHQRTKKGNK